MDSSLDTSERLRSFRDLMIWQRSRALVKIVYDVSAQFPRDEQYGLTAQIRRAVISVPSNIAEGSAKRSTKDFRRHLNIAYGSLAELETQMLLAIDLGYALPEHILSYEQETAEIGRMINGLISKLDTKLNSEL